MPKAENLELIPAELKTNPLVLSGHLLPIMERFHTLQGEGYYAGKAAFFIRLGGCLVGCHWCDVKESWDALAHPLVSVEQLAAEASAYKGSIIVITGGEPVQYNLNPLINALKAEGFQVNMETSGAFPLQGTLDWLCLSPKKFKAPLPEYYPLAHELKVVVFHPSDIQWAEKHAAEIQAVNPNCKLYLQPEWDKRETITPLLINYIQQNPKWGLSLQTHKYLSIP